MESEGSREGRAARRGSLGGRNVAGVWRGGRAGGGRVRGRQRGGFSMGGRGWRGGRSRGRGGRFVGRGSGFDFRDRKPAEPTAETLALMGKRAEESTVGISHFLHDTGLSISGVLKQRYSDFIVREVAQDGELCKGTDFPGLLHPIKNTTSRSETPKPVAIVEEEVTESRDGDGEGQQCSDNEVTDSHRGITDDIKNLVKERVGDLACVLGTDLTSKVETFMLEGLASEGKDRPTFTLPPAEKSERAKVYELLKQKLSKFVQAITICDPNPGMSAGVRETRALDQHDACSGRVTNAEDSTAGEKAGNAPVSAVTHGESAIGNGSTSKEIASHGAAVKTDGGEAENEGQADAAARTSSGGDDGNRVAKQSVQKCVQLTVKRDWRKVGGKRGRNDLGSERGSWPTDRPEYCRFVLYKENCDTMGAVSRICKALKFSGKLLTYAGTKDKRAVTSQWCTVKQKSVEELRKFNRPLGTFQGHMVLVGNFSYISEPLKLGALKGNKFGIVLRNISLPPCPTEMSETTSSDKNEAQKYLTQEHSDEKGLEDIPQDEEASAQREEAIVEKGKRLKEVIDERCQCVKEKGFINYFGLQRFGSGGTPTSDVGMAMVKQDWEGAVKLVMTPRMGENEATHDSKVHFLKNPSDIEGTLARLPFFMDAEKNMMQALLKGGPRAYIQALRAVPKNLQLMYLHAFQSLLWNLAASERIKLYGRKGAVQGDLVFSKHANMDEVDSMLMESEAAISKHEDKPYSIPQDIENEQKEGAEEENVADIPESREAKRARKTREALPEVHVVTAEDVKQGTFELTDVVLPMPGHGVTYPANAVRDCYTRALEERGMTEECFGSSSERAFTLGGMYRRLVQIPKDMSWEVKRYEDHTLHLMNTDIDDLLDADDARIAAEQVKDTSRTSGIDDINNPSTSTDDTSEGKADPKSGASRSADTKAAQGAGSSVDAMDVTDVATPSNSELKEEVPSSGEKTKPSQGHNYALCLSFTLQTAAYATMCLREITRQDTSSAFHTHLGGGSARKPHTSASNEACDTREMANARGDEREIADESSPPPKPRTPRASKGALIRVGSSLKK